MTPLLTHSQVTAAPTDIQSKTIQQVFGVLMIQTAGQSVVLAREILVKGGERHCLDVILHLSAVDVRCGMA